MSRNYIFKDLKGALQGLELVISESIKYHKNVIENILDNSSIVSLIEEKSKSCPSKLSNLSQNDVANAVKETFERVSMVGHGLKAYATAPTSQTKSKSELVKEDESNFNPPYQVNAEALPKGVSPEDLKVSELDHKDKELLEKLEREIEEKRRLKMQMKKQEESFPRKEGKSEAEESFPRFEERDVKKSSEDGVGDVKKIEQPTAVKYKPKKQQLNPEAKQRRVPSSRIGRMISFGGLAAGLGIGAVAEATRRTLGISGTTQTDEPPTLDQLFLTEANAERIVNTLCRVRGAALKIGQILSIQDNTVISPVLQKAFERVRQSADFMPTWQVHKVLAKELGPDWRDKLKSFEEKPFAAASIGQVHYVQLKDGRECAMKIQYPGVAEGIASDINNLVGVLKVWNVFPKGLFIDNLVEVAKRELSWEVDFYREAECTKKFKALLAPYPEYVVPDVIDELSTGRVFTSTLIQGMPVDQCTELDEEHRERIAKLIMHLCLREVFVFQYMQTDPNWSNFFYDPSTRKLSLLDFGASRSYEKEFVKKYIEVIKAAADGDRERVLKISQEMGFLTGYESKNMQEAHVSAVMILAEVFSSEKPFDFGRQDTTRRIQKLVPTIISERLSPPPEEIYSLHRKLSGVFLLCTKLKVKISCREMFLQVYRKFKEDLD